MSPKGSLCIWDPCFGVLRLALLITWYNVLQLEFSSSKHQQIQMYSEDGVAVNGPLCCKWWKTSLMALSFLENPTSACLGKKKKVFITSHGKRPEARWVRYSWVSALCSVTKSCLTLCDFTDCSLPGSSVLGILQARKLCRLPFPPSGDLLDPPPSGHRTWVPCISCIGKQILLPLSYLGSP